MRMFAIAVVLGAVAAFVVFVSERAKAVTDARVVLWRGSALTLESLPFPPPAGIWMWDSQQSAWVPDVEQTVSFSPEGVIVYGPVTLRQPAERARDAMSEKTKPSPPIASPKERPNDPQ